MSKIGKKSPLIRMTLRWTFLEIYRGQRIVERRGDASTGEVVRGHRDHFENRQGQLRRGVADP